jgi:glutamate dehydrogenase
MTVKPEEAKAALVEKAIAQVRERLSEPQAADVERFVRAYYAETAPEDLAELDLYGAALSHWHLLQRRRPGEAKVHVYTPQVDEHGWQSPHSVVETVTDDMPFLVDSVAMALTRRGSAIHLSVHPIVRVRRDADGRLQELLPWSAEGPAESLLHVEIDRQADQALLDELEAELHRVLADVRAAVEDWPAMRGHVREIVAELDESPPPVDPDELAETKALLEWIHGDHFTFLGYREYELRTQDGEEVLASVPGSGLGILRQAGQKPVSHSFAQLPPEVRSLARSPNPLILTKANSRATVHRPAYLDYVGAKRFDDAGDVCGERRFLGLFTHTAYSASAWEIPVLRHKVERVVERSGFAPGGHDHKALVEILETYPRDELFQIPEDELFEIALGILHLGERRRVRLFVRREAFGRFLSCLVYLPLDRYNTEVRQRIEQILLDAFAGTSVDLVVRVSESVLARLHLVVRTDRGTAADYDVSAIEARLVEATRTWSDDLHDALVDQLGEARAASLFRRYADAFPAAYREDFDPRAAVADIERIERLSPEGDLDLSLYLPLDSQAGHLAFKLLRSGDAILLSDVLPLLENMGVKVTDERPFEVRPLDGRPVWIYDFGLECGEDVEFATERVRQIFQDAFAEVWRGVAENDGFNRLVLGAGLTWREIALLRAIAKYLRQAGSAFSQTYMEETLADNAQLARQLAELFRLRFEPSRPSGSDAKAGELVREIEDALDAVAGLDQDRILRSFLSVILAMLRTNYFRTDEDGRPRPYLSFKLDPALVPALPAPRPMFEIFVYSPRMEGVHLRAGRVARGGIRWSDRREDFRTEILGLMKAQTVKNAVIVPTGAKGGFVLKRPPADREALRDEVVACYRTLMRGLLDLTDTLAAGEVVPPSELVRYDDDDPYLVVAADKGTATFSDIANALSAEYGFWLGDAFASGGSAGYDHKRMAITARGAWESVKRHLRELGTDIDSTDFTVVGIGDMSGDVFGNGILLSRRIKLLAAFDHRHVFLDPDPDPELSFEERARLFALPASSWADYDEKLISPGGGVFARTAKSVPLSPEARTALGIEAGTLTPNELIRALLRAPVDLLWNGGIGTFVKAKQETHAEVGDRASDAIRVDADDLRCRVVGEGGNLGLTQRARIAYALRGGRVLMDAIDNSAGVDCSDHEVNIKILLDAIVADGDLTAKQRNVVLAEMTDEVAELVLRDNYEQTQAIGTSVAQASSMVDVHARYIRTLEQAGRLDRALEFLPDEEALTERKAAGQGLTAPEFAILLSYTKIALYEELLASDLPDDPYLTTELERYFPTEVRERFRTRLARHSLRREIVAAQVTNSLVNRAGTTFVFRLGEETGATSPDIARAVAVAREVFDMRSLWAEIEALDGRIAVQTQIAMLLRVRVLLERATRWLLRHQPRPLDIAAAIAHFAPGTAALAEAGSTLLPAAHRAAAKAVAEELADAGVPPDLANRVAHLEALVPALDLVEIAAATGLTFEEVAGVYFEIGDRLELDSLRDRIAALPREERWDALARRALWEDLLKEQRALATDVLRESGNGPMPERVSAWIARNAQPVERCLQLLADVKAGSAYDLAMLSVAVREIRNLIEATPAPARDASEPIEPAAAPLSGSDLPAERPVAP